MAKMVRNPNNPFAAPGYLEAVRRLVNTLDIEAGIDHLGEREDGQRWLADWGFLGDSSELSSSELGHIRDLREALRTLMDADRTHGETQQARSVLTDALRRGTRPVVMEDRIGFEVIGEGIDRVLGVVASIVAKGMVDGSWERMKVCSNDSCRWAFFDGSRNRTSRWCRMETCGNRAKARRYRERHTSARSTSFRPVGAR